MKWKSKRYLQKRFNSPMENIHKTFSYIVFLCLYLTPLHGEAQLELCGGNSGDPIFMEDFGTGASRTPLPDGTTSYTFKERGNPLDGEYTVFNSSDFLRWHKVTDHTANDPNGKFLVVNADFTPGEFYRTTIDNLCEGTSYVFSTWLANLMTDERCGRSCHPINVRFEIWDEDDTILLASGDTGDIPSTKDPEWRQYGLVFTTLAAQFKVILKLKNNGRGGYGNDLAIDDIVFKSCGDEVTVTNADNATSVTVCESDGLVPLTLTANADGSVFSTHAYQWQESVDGSNWNTIAGANGATYAVPQVTSNRFYRTLVAENAANVTHPSCNVVSDTFQTIVVPTPEPPLSNSDVSFCEGEQATLQVQVPQDIAVRWYDVPTGGSPLHLGTSFTTENEGTFYAEAVSTIVSCSSSSRTAVAAIEVKNPDINDEDIGLCPGERITISANFPDADYLWNTGATTENIEIDRQGIYSVTVTNAHGCSSTKTITVLDAVGAAAPTSMGDQVFCEGEAASIGVVAPANTIIRWYAAQNGGIPLLEDSSTYAPLETGTYFAEAVSSLSGCVSQTRTPVHVTFIETPAIENETLAICQGSSAIISADFPNADYLWSTGATTETITVDRAGTYSVTVTNANTCSSTKTIDVRLLDRPDPPISNGDVSICESAEPRLHVQVPKDITVSWYDVPVGGSPLQQGSASFGPMVPGIYYAEAASLDGCVSISRTPVVLHGPGEPVLLEERHEICEGASITLSADAPDATYLWNTGATTETISVDRTGTYTVTVSDDRSCSSMKTIIVALAPTPEIMAIVSKDRAVVITATGSTTLQYSLDGIVFQDSPTFEPVLGGRYIVYVRNGPECPAIQQEFLHLVIPKFFTPNGDGYHDDFKPQGVEFATSYEIAIYNRWGALLAQSQSAEFSWDGNLGGNPLPASDYWYSIQVDNSIFKGHFSLKR